MVALLFIDSSKASKRVITSKLYNSIKTRITIVETGTLSDSISPADYNIMAFPTIVDRGQKYCGVNAVFEHMEKMARDPRYKPLF